MCRAFTSGFSAVMAGNTGTSDLGVIDVVGRCPDDPVMAVLANIGRLYVGRSLAGRLGAVVTVNAITADVDMIEVRRNPGLGSVAVITSNTTVDVGRVFAGRNGAIVAGTTTTDDLGVVDRGCRNPKRTIVAVFTNVGRLYMGWTLARGGGAIVTANAVVRDTGVFEAGR